MIPATSHDVARRAGVSIATVSRVVNDLPHVTPPIRRKVLRAIKELNYQPSRAAQRLRAKRSRVIGLIISDIQNPFFTSVGRSIEDAAHRHGYSLVLCNSDEESEKEKLYINIMRAEEVAGVIVATTLEKNPHIHHLLSQGIPVVAVDRQLRNRRVDSVLVDNIRGAYEAVSHLIQLGHRRIGFIGLPMGMTPGRERYQGYLLAHRKHGIAVTRSLVCIGNAKPEGGYKQAKELLRCRPPITALFVANNMMTLGALAALDERGRKIPDEISIVGFDDLPWAELLQPPLTVVAQPTYELGQKAAELLLERIEQANKPVTHIRLKPTLIVRASSGPASH